MVCEGGCRHGGGGPSAPHPVPALHGLERAAPASRGRARLGAALPCLRSGLGKAGSRLASHPLHASRAKVVPRAGGERGAVTAIPLRVAPPLVSTALTMVGAGVMGSLLPLRFSAMGLSPGVIGLIATAEALGFLVGCLHAHRIIAPVGLERAYAAFAGMKAVAILRMHFADGVATLAVLRFLLGANAAGLSVIVE